MQTCNINVGQMLFSVSAENNLGMNVNRSVTNVKLKFFTYFYNANSIPRISITEEYLTCALNLTQYVPLEYIVLQPLEDKSSQ